MRSAERKIDGRSAEPIPPGTMPAAAGLASGVASGLEVAPPSASASGMSNGGSVGPAPVSEHRRGAHRERSREQLRRVTGQPGRDARRGSRPPSAAATDTPEPTTTISRQPSRSAKDPSAKVTVAPVASGVDRSVRYPQTSRIVERPPAPGGNASPASVRLRAVGTSSTRRSRLVRRSSQTVSRAASVSASETRPSPSTSSSSRAWKAGISARSMTTSSRIRSGSIRSPRSG